MNIKYGLVVLDPKTREILHFCGYENEPTEADMESLRDELRYDPEFGLQAVAGRIIIQRAGKKVVERYCELVKDKV
jgi:hypothetical protein